MLVFLLEIEFTNSEIVWFSASLVKSAKSGAAALVLLRGDTASGEAPSYSDPCATKPLFPFKPETSWSSYSQEVSLLQAE